MLEWMRDRPFALLVPGALALLVLMVCVEIKELRRPATRSIVPPRLEGFEDLAQPRLSQELMIGRGKEVLRGLGYEPQNYYHGLEIELDESAFRFLKDRPRAEAVEFVQKGAPLITWKVTFFRPQESIEHRERLVVTLDVQGRLCGFRGYRYGPEQLREPPSEAWREEVRSKVAGWLEIPQEKLHRVESLELMGSGHERADAAWRVEGMPLEGASVVVSVRQKGEFLNFTRSILLPRDLGYIGYAWQGYDFWTALFLAIPLAFIMGLCWGRAKPEAAGRWLKPALFGGLGLASAICLAQAAAMWESNFVFALAFASTLPFFALLAFKLKQHLPHPSAVTLRMRAALITAVPLAYLIMSIGCSANLFTGCAEVCTLVRYISVPLGLFALLLGWGDRRFYVYGLSLCAFSLIPHCICDNFINHCWIEWFGVSPMCYFFSFCVALVSVIGLCGVLPRLCVLASAGTAVFVLLMAAGHQLFSFPW